LFHLVVSSIMEVETIFDEIAVLIYKCTKCECLEDNLENLNEEELSDFLRLLKKVNPVTVKKKKTETLKKKLNEKVNFFFKIKAELLKLKKKSDSIHFDQTLNMCKIIEQEMREGGMNPEKILKINQDLDVIEENCIQCSLIVAKLRCLMYHKILIEKSREEEAAFFEISIRTLDFYISFHKLTNKYPQLLRMRLAWSIVAKQKLFIENEVARDLDLQTVCRNAYDPFFNTPDVVLPRPRTISQ